MSATKPKPNPKPRRSHKPPRRPGDPYTVAEAAAAMRVSERTVRNLVSAGQLEANRVGLGRGTIRIPEHALAGYEAARKGRELPAMVSVGRKHLGRRGK